jgi:hypothetical protein
MGLTKEEFLGLKVGDKVVRKSVTDVFKGRYTAGKEYEIIEVVRNPEECLGFEYRIRFDNGASGWVWFMFAENWELPKSSPTSNYPEVTSVFVSPGIQPENNLKLVLQ